MWRARMERQRVQHGGRDPAGGGLQERTDCVASFAACQRAHSDQWSGDFGFDLDALPVS